MPSARSSCARVAATAWRSYAVKRRLSPVSRSWHHALKKTVSVLTSRLDDYEEHRDLLRNKKDTAHHIRVRVYGERDPAVYG